MGFLTGKRLVVAGSVTPGSIAHAVVGACRREGAALALLGTHIKAGSGVDIGYACDLSNDTQCASAMDWLAAQWPHADGIFHAIAPPGPGDDEDFIDALSRARFGQAHEACAYRFAALVKAALPLLRNGASIVTASQAGARRAMPGSSVSGLAHASLEATVRYLAAALGPRGIRVNAISAGLLHADACAGGPQAGALLDYVERSAPLRRAVRPDEVANLAAFLLSDLASGITAQVSEVDAGFGTVVGAVPV